MPNNEVSLFIVRVTSWIEWYDYVHEASAWYESKCPDYIKDDVSLFKIWLESQKEKEKSKINNPGRR